MTQGRLAGQVAFVTGGGRGIGRTGGCGWASCPRAWGLGGGNQENEWDPVPLIGTLMEFPSLFPVQRLPMTTKKLLPFILATALAATSLLQADTSLRCSSHSSHPRGGGIT